MTALILLRDWQASQIEFWRVIPSFPEHDVSSFGRVRSWHGAQKRRPKPLMLKLATHRQGYLYVEPQYSGRKRLSFVHRLVASAFIPNPENLPEVNHLTGLKSDNRPEGLEWSTRLHNQQHAWQAGLITRAHLKKNRNLVRRRFTDDQIREIRLRCSIGVETQTVIGVLFGTSGKNISDIFRRTRYADVI